MTDIASSVMVASMIVGVLTVPAASETISASENVSTDLPEISGSKSIPEEVSTNSSPNSFTREVETAFQEFRTDISSDSAVTSVESADSRLRIQKSPERTEWILESSQGELRITRSSSKMVEKVETPYGSLKTVEENGGVRESFEGSDREKVESIAEDLRAQMKEKKQTIEEQRKQTRLEQYSQRLEISEINQTKDFVVIENSMSQKISLEGWKLADESDTGSYKFGAVSVPAEGSLYVYTDEEADLEVSESSGSSYVYDSGIAWNQGSDTATLWFNGEKVAEKSY